MLPLTICQNCGKFSVEKAVMKTRRPGKILREVAIWCEATVTLPRWIPLLSRREEMPCRVRPLKRQ